MSRVYVTPLVAGLFWACSSQTVSAQINDPPLDAAAQLERVSEIIGREAIARQFSDQYVLELKPTDTLEGAIIPISSPDLISPSANDVPIYIRDAEIEALNGTVDISKLDYQLQSLAEPDFSIRRDQEFKVDDYRYTRAEMSLGSLKTLIDRDIQPEQRPDIPPVGVDWGPPVIPQSVLDEVNRHIQNIQSDMTGALEREDYRNAAVIALEFGETSQVSASAALNPGNIAARAFQNLVPKAVYGINNTVSADRLDLMLSQRRYTVGLTSKGGRNPHCTGVFLPPHYILTAAHCEKDRRGRNLMSYGGIDIMFDHIAGQNPTSVLANRSQIIARGHVNPRGARDPLDYMVLTVPQASLPARNTPTICLDTDPMPKGTAVYAFGHGNSDPLRYHAAGALYLPFEIPKADFDMFLLALGQDEFSSFVAKGYQGISANNYTNLHVSLRDMAISQMEKTIKLAHNSYQLTPGGDRFRLNYSQDLTLAPQNSQGPVMAVTLDFAGGDSGAPVFNSQKHQCVSGMLIRGIDDTRRGVKANWFNNEHVLPILAILEDLQSQPSADAKTVYQDLKNLVR